MEDIIKNHYDKRVVIDIASGKVLERDSVFYRGPWSKAANQRPKQMKSWDMLKQSITPMIAGEGERVPWAWYHRLLYTSGTTTTLTFFNATGVPTTTNMEAAGQIPAPMYFDVYHIGVYFDLGVTNANITAAGNQVTGALNDVINLMDGIATLQLAQKTYFRVPIWMLPPGAGAYGHLAEAGTFAADTGDLVQQGQNGNPDLRNRYTHWGDITIPHNQNFSVVLDWAAAVTVNFGNVDIITIIDGFLYRRVL